MFGLIINDKPKHLELLTTLAAVLGLGIENVGHTLHFQGRYSSSNINVISILARGMQIVEWKMRLELFTDSYYNYISYNGKLMEINATFVDRSTYSKCAKERKMISYIDD